MDEAFTHYQFDGRNLIDNGLGFFGKKNKNKILFTRLCNGLKKSLVNSQLHANGN